MVAQHHADAKAPQAAREVGVHAVPLFGLHQEGASGEDLLHGAFKFDKIITGHGWTPSLELGLNGGPLRSQGPIAAVAALAALAGCSRPDRDPLTVPNGAVVLDQVTVVDALQVRPHAAVVLSGRRIHAVLDAGGPWPAHATVLDLPGRTVIPGLIDAHVHLFHSGALDPVGPTLDHNLAAQLAWGVVGVADLGAPEAVFELRDDVAAGRRVGPRIWATGPMLTAAGSHPCETDHDPHLCRFVDGDGPAQVAALARADGLKVALADAAFSPWPTPRLDLDDLADITAAAAAAHQPVTVHVDAPSDASDAADAGAWMLAHPVFSEAVANPVALPVTSTLAAFDGPQALEQGDLLGDDLSGTPEAVIEDWTGWRDRLDAFLPGWVEESAAWSEAARANLATRHARGDALLAGSDAGYWLVPHGLALHRELRALVDLGLSPRDAIEAATLTPALALGWTDLGEVAAGQAASLVVLAANPLSDIDHTRAIEQVWVDGALVQPEDALAPGNSGVCTSDADCGPGDGCDGLASVCVRACDAAFDPFADCGPDAACLPGDGLPGGAPVCRGVRGCDPYAQDCAPALYAEACLPLDLDTSACWPAGNGAVGDDCGWDAPEAGCAAGLYCSPVTETCFELCDPDHSDTCGAGTCQRQRVDGEPWFGLCY